MTGRPLFVYGTLRRGGSNDIARMRPAPQLLGVAAIAGRLYNLGAYPGLVLDSAAGSVRGELYWIAPELERRLDRLEGVSAPPRSDDEYFKRKVSVQQDGRAIDCLVYEINPQRVVAAPLIGGGDWLDWLARPRD
ncbi:MAG: hypothetical protein OJF60_002448 [Burkholderiaceae bacterium]|jgi:gamma-glutamylcyclotransferase (GGCT)/AIG2-like uncharacterized protein YtfP|nr:MAG: hypothetical protein OJF60_002448 [Burkholderiaceae bacterium]